MPGPIPNRSDQRRRTNKPEGVQVTKAEGAELVVKPDADPDWHPIAVRWFDSLKTSGQSAFYEDSDWATAYLIAESIDRELKDQPIIMGAGETRRIEWVKQPVSGTALAGWLKAMGSLLVTEGDRRRARLELERPTAEEVPADVDDLAEYRARLAAQSG